MNKSQNAGEVQEAESSSRRLALLREGDHRPHRGTELFSVIAYRATPVLRTMATTEVAGDPSDGGDGVEPSSPTLEGSRSATLLLLLLLLLL